MVVIYIYIILGCTHAHKYTCCEGIKEQAAHMHIHTLHTCKLPTCTYIRCTHASCTHAHKYNCSAGIKGLSSPNCSYHVRICICVCVCVCETNACVNKAAYTSIHPYIHTYIRAHLHTYLHMCKTACNNRRQLIFHIPCIHIYLVPHS